ncbi:MAG: imidazolonepropionase [Owenweeksia sp.]
MSYAEIAALGGGILNSAKKLQQASEEELYEVAARRLEEVMQMGTGAIEIKSGYGLSTESEIKMLKVARKLGENYPLPVKTTFLGAHAFPEKFKNDHQGYVRLITDEMLPEIAARNLADYVDVFCEEGYFSVDEMIEILQTAQKFNIKSKLHLNQFNSLDSIEKAISHDALSVDHLEVMTAHDKTLLAGSDTIATLLPGCSLFLEIPYAPARDLIDQNAIVSLATDYNPGSAPSGNMNLMVSLACIKMKMTPEEAISAATLNGAAAIELSDQTGSIEKGKKANFMITKPLTSPSFLPYNFGHHLIDKVFINGKQI